MKINDHGMLIYHPVSLFLIYVFMLDVKGTL